MAVGKRMKFFSVSGKNDPKACCAKAPSGENALLTAQELAALDRELVLSVSRGVLSDYLPSNSALCLCSQKIKEVLDRYRLSDDTYKFLPLKVKVQDELYPYFALWFPHAVDVMDPKKTTYVPGTDSIRRPVFKAEVLEKRSVVPRGSSDTVWVVSQDVRDALKRLGCTGLAFQEVVVSGRIFRRPKPLDSQNQPPGVSCSSESMEAFNVLPPELQEFLASGSELKYDASQSEPGKVELKHPGMLELSFVYVDASTRWKRAYFEVPAISLTSESEGYDPEFLLLYLPREQLFGSWDGDHWGLHVFSGATWGKIAENPVTYLNSQWRPGPGAFELFDPKLSYKKKPGRPF